MSATTPGWTTAGPRVFATPRLVVDELVEADAPFILELLTDPAFLRYIGDRGVQDLEGARRYVEAGPRASYAAHGYGLWRVALRDGGTPIGICGVLKRPTLPEPDLGFAFLPAYRGCGYAFEAARATLAHARDGLGLGRILAITTRDNVDSIALLGRLGFRDEGEVEGAPGGAPLRLFAHEPG